MLQYTHKIATNLTAGKWCTEILWSIILRLITCNMHWKSSPWISNLIDYYFHWTGLKINFCSFLQVQSLQIWPGVSHSKNISHSSEKWPQRRWCPEPSPYYPCQLVPGALWYRAEWKRAPFQVRFSHDSYQVQIWPDSGPISIMFGHKISHFSL